MIRTAIMSLLSATALLATLGAANAAEVVPRSCHASITTGPQSDRGVECSRVIVITHDNGTSSISFLSRDSDGAWLVIRARIEGTDVEDAVTSRASRNFPIEAFFIHPVEDTRRRPARFPLQGGCSVSAARIACSANDAVGGFTVDAQF